MARKCIFCGNYLRGQQKSKEHIFPQWLQEHQGLGGEQLYQTRYTTEGRIDNVRECTFHTHVSGLICKKCNTDWMSELERQAKPLLTPLLDDTFKGHLRQNDCQIIAQWLFKTALTLHSVSQREAKLIPAEHYTTFYETRAIPAGVLISIAHFEGEGDLFWIENQAWRGRPRGVSTEKLNAYFKQTYTITLRVGHLAWRVHYWPVWPKENGAPFKVFEYQGNSIRHVYPVGPGGISWPPAESISDLHELDESFFIL